MVSHEAALRAQARKMNVESLRSNAKDNKESQEIKIAKVTSAVSSVRKAISEKGDTLSGNKIPRECCQTFW